MLQALAHDAHGHHRPAQEALERALTESPETDGYAQLFIDEGAPMVRLLRGAEEREVTRDRVRRLLRRVTPDRAAAPSRRAGPDSSWSAPLSQLSSGNPRHRCHSSRLAPLRHHDRQPGPRCDDSALRGRGRKPLRGSVHLAPWPPASHAPLLPRRLRSPRAVDAGRRRTAATSSRATRPDSRSGQHLRALGTSRLRQRGRTADHQRSSIRGPPSETSEGGRRGAAAGPHRLGCASNGPRETLDAMGASIVGLYRHGFRALAPLGALQRRRRRCGAAVGLLHA